MVTPASVFSQEVKAMDDLDLHMKPFMRSRGWLIQATWRRVDPEGVNMFFFFREKPSEQWYSCKIYYPEFIPLENLGPEDGLERYRSRLQGISFPRSFHRCDPIACIQNPNPMEDALKHDLGPFGKRKVFLQITGPNMMAHRNDWMIGCPKIQPSQPVKPAIVSQFMGWVKFPDNEFTRTTSRLVKYCLIHAEQWASFTKRLNSDSRWSPLEPGW